MFRATHFTIFLVSLVALGQGDAAESVQVCDNLFELELLTDKKGGETQFSLFDSHDNVWLSQEAGTYEANSRYTETLCLPNDDVFTLSIQGSTGGGDFAVFLQGRMVGAGAITAHPEPFQFETISPREHQVETEAKAARGLKPANAPVAPIALKGTKAPVAPKGTKAPIAPKGTKAPIAPKGTKAPIAPKGTKAPIAPKGTKAPIAPKGTKSQMPSSTPSSLPSSTPTCSVSASYEEPCLSDDFFI